MATKTCFLKQLILCSTWKSHTGLEPDDGEYMAEFLFLVKLSLSNNQSAIGSPHKKLTMYTWTATCGAM